MLCLAEEALVSGPAHAWYLSLAHPAGTIPEWLFRPTWGCLALASGVAAWLVWRRAPVDSAGALRLWGWSLFAMALRAACLFGVRNLPSTLLASIVCGALLIVILRAFQRRSRAAGWLMVPSLLWTGYVIYLSAGFLVLNPG